MIDTEFYERIAADVCGTYADRLWEKTRDEDVVLARYFCIVYRKDTLGLSIKKSAERYFKNRSMYYWAVRDIELSVETKSHNGSLWKLFLKKCADEASVIGDIPVSMTSVISVKQSLSNIGWGTYCESKKRLFMNFFNDLRSGDDEESLRKRLPELNTVVEEIGWLLQNE